MKKTFFAILLISGILFAQTQYLTLGTWNSIGVPNYLDPVNDIVTPEFLASINQSLPEKSSVLLHHPQFLATTAQTNIVITEPAEVWVTFINEGAGYQNALGFYTYDVNSPPATINDIRSTMTIVFPNVSLPGYGGNLKPGNRVKIGQFAPNTVIGWFVISNGFTNGNLGNGYWTFFSNDNLNPETNVNVRRHNVLLNDPSTNRIVLGFEDIKRESGSCDNDFNDVLFSIKSNPITAVNLTNIPMIDNPNASNFADLKIEKTVDNENPNHGDFVNWTVVVTNLGPSAADNVRVTDFLPLGLEFDSYIATIGTYTPSDGLWVISNIPNGQSVTLTLKARVNLYAHTYDLGLAKDFNVFVLNDINQPSSDTEGRVAVGNNAYFSNYSVGDKLPPSGGTVDVLVVENSLTYLSGSVYGGNVVYGNNTNLPLSSVSIVDGTLRQADLIDFDAARQSLLNLSGMLKNYTVNGTTEFQYNQIKLTGTNPVLNVFSVDGAELSLANDYLVNVPNGSVVLVNISGEFVQWTGGHVVNGTAINNVLYNFYDAVNLNIHHIDVRGSILAPKAELSFPTGLISGQVIVNNITGIGQFNYEMFLGSIPLDNKITNSVVISSLTQIDLVSSNNSSAAQIMVGGATNPNANNSGIVTWSQNSALANQELIWTIFYNNTDLYVGTWGGKILRSTDNGITWTHLNSNMNVGYIWSVKIASNGTIFAGTELGVFRSTNNGVSWETTNLVNQDVRALAVDSSNCVYAGLWGGGIKKSTDMGLTWLEVNNGLVSPNVHALAYKEGVGLFAGTFGAGVLKSIDGGANWTKLNVGFEQIWSLAISKDNKIYAGTYGDGVYKSVNGGDSWLPFNAGLPSKHIYSISLDQNNNVYISAWAAGVYMITGTKSNWKPVGMEGFDVSSIAVSPSNVIYAGTAYGAVYSGPIDLTSAEETADMVYEYNLEQNYPNPFNPSTVIEFSLKTTGMVKLSVFNILGEEVKALVNSEMPAGKHSVIFNATGLNSGIYLYRITTPGQTMTKKMILMK